MSRRYAIAPMLAIALTLGAGTAHGEATITVAVEANRPPAVEIRAGEAVRWINVSGATAHVWFFPDPIGFYIGLGGAVIRFDKPGTYEYLVHITGVTTHTHTGNVVVR